MALLVVWDDDYGRQALSREIVARVLAEEAGALGTLANRLGEEFSTAVEWVMGCSGRVVTCGIGKSGHIAEKAAATFASTGTPSFFLHAAEAVHGDLGMVTQGDVVLAYTYSGETDEVVRLFPSFRSQGAKTMVMTGKVGSTAGRSADLVLDVAVDREACPNNLAPTTSTTAMLAVSDALAVAVMEARNFGSDDFAKFHPAGALGRRLLLTVGDVMRTGEDLAVVSRNEGVLGVMRAMTKAGSGGACVVSDEGEVEGFISDGDLRRWFVSTESPLEGTAVDLMKKPGVTCEPGLLAFDALEVFQNFPAKIGEMPVVDEGRLVGLLVLKDLLRSGIV